MPRLLGFQQQVPAQWTSGEPAGAGGRPVGTPSRPYVNALATPGTYYHPGSHPYTRRLPGGLEVQDAYTGQYYSLSADPTLPSKPLPWKSLLPMALLGGLIGYAFKRSSGATALGAGVAALGYWGILETVKRRGA